MLFVVVNADFSGCKNEDRAYAYEALLKEEWINLYGDAEDTHSIWINAVTDDMQEDEAIAISKTKFFSCCKSGSYPNVSFEWGYNESGYYNVAS